MTRLFVYGTLMFPEVASIVAGAPLRTVEATLDGFERVSLRERVYPAIVPRPGRSVTGRVVEDVSPAVLARFDAFEDVLYDRLPLKPRIDAGEVEAEGYVLSPRFQKLASSRAWAPDAFLQEHGDAYLARCREWAKTGSW